MEQLDTDQIGNFNLLKYYTRAPISSHSHQFLLFSVLLAGTFYICTVYKYKFKFAIFIGVVKYT